MKKIFTTLFLGGLCLGASAQILTVSVDGKPVANGETVASSHLDVTEFDGVVLMWELKPETTIKVSETANLMVTVTNPEGQSKVTYTGKDVEAAPINFCGVTVAGGMPGNCIPIKPGASETQTQVLKPLSEGVLECYFMSTDFTNPVPESLDAYAVVKIEAEGDSGAEETFEFTLNMKYPSTGVKVIAGDEAVYTIEGGRVVAEGEVEVYDLAGRRVANEGLSGMYVVRVDGKTAKVVVK